MFDFGDEFVFESYRIPWLLWIQLLVMFLILILLYCFSIFAFDLFADNSAAPPLSTTPIAAAVDESLRFNSTPNRNNTNVTSCLRSTKVRENQSEKGDIGTSSGRRIKEKEAEMEGCSTKDGAHVAVFGHSDHPCHLFGLARQAFLKCLGLDFLCESSSSRRKRKDQ